MKIHSRLQVGLVLSVTLCGLIILIFFWAVSVMEAAQLQHDTASEIRKILFDRVNLRDEYLLFQEERPKRQWLAKQQEADQLLASGTGLFQDPKALVLIDRLNRVNSATRLIFLRLVENRAGLATQSMALPFSRNLETSLVSQLLHFSFESNSTCLELEMFGNELLISTQKQVAMMVILLAVLILPVLAWSSVSTKRLITAHLAVLSQGTAIWGGGDLDFRLRVVGNDELSDLAEACNLMADRMKGSLTSIQTLEREVVERLGAEQELRVFHGRLEELVKTRTAELCREIEVRQKAEEAISHLNQELKANLTLLKTTNKELEGFSYTVSHDLRAPLRHLIGFVELLNKRAPPELDEKSRHYLEVISEAAKKMSQLVDDLLSFSRMGRSGMMHTVVSLDTLVQEARETLLPETADREILWKIEPLPEVLGDPAMLRLVVINLLANALKFTKDRPKAQITIGCQVKEGMAECFIRDNGVGFDMAYVNKLFNLFQRLHPSSEFEGTGLGLAIVQRIIHRHGGQTSAEGAIDQGATIFFSLPRPIRA